MELSTFGKGLIVVGLCCVIAGLVLLFLPKIPGGGRLPGDILIKRDNVTFYFPLTTSILVSLILTLLIRFFHK